MIAPTVLDQYRNQTFQPGKVQTLEQAVRFVRERGFIFFWPIQGIPLPSLWVAVAGDRPVASNQSDPGHITWTWKDRLLGKKRWYYAKVLKRKGTLIGLELAPAFYALSQNYGDPEEDYLEQYREGQLSTEAKQVYEVLLAEGPLHTQLLRKKAGLKNELYRFGKALEELQADFKILPIGVVKAGRWKYAFEYECVHRHYPELLTQARRLSSPEARSQILEAYFRSLGAALLSEVRKLLSWDLEDTLEALEILVAKGRLVSSEDPTPNRAFILAELLAQAKTGIDPATSRPPRRSRPRATR
ncbi:DNA glycosylase AlkZ-like family protein [Meiothermus granaticius]|uniref:AlkZ-related protein n=1 Tax=Meiothermus granaticius TaxID=863370 RepID=UPI001475772E|nr:crosslink repair DNA glycosylase YcaQ family protein [Meiothermus granaticius]